MLCVGGQIQMVFNWNPTVSTCLFFDFHFHSFVVIRQNNVEELYSLIKFLRLRPLNEWETFNEQIAKPVKGGRPTRALKRLHVSSQFAFCNSCIDRTPLCHRLS